MDIQKLPGLPEVQFHKNGYELRADLLGLAKNIVFDEFNAKFNLWEVSQKQEDGKLVTSVTMPEIPGLKQVLDAAKELNSFLQGSAKKSTGSKSE